MHAWAHFLYTATRIPGEEEIRIGYDPQGREIEMVAVLTLQGWLNYHAMTPPSKRTKTEIDRALRRR